MNNSVPDDFKDTRLVRVKDINELIDEQMTDIELCYIDDPDNCAVDDERWLVLEELKVKINGEQKQ